MLKPPPTRYAHSGEAMIAYQVVGEGPVDLIVVGGPASHLDLEWEEPSIARAFEHYASFCRLVRFDRRGTGLSDPVDDVPTLEQQMDDLEAVMDAAGIERAALSGTADAGLAPMYAATHPERVSALILIGVTPAASYPLGVGRREEFLDIVEHGWGQGRMLPIFAPSRVGDRRFEEWWTRFERACITPSMARKVIDLYQGIDLRGVLPAIRVPTLVLARRDSPLAPVELVREAAELIPGARFAEIPGGDTFGWPDAEAEGGAEIEEFLTGRRRLREPERQLATVLFTDIVGSTDRAAELGDSAWRELLGHHDALVRDELRRHRGREVKTTGDGFLATFDGPARAVRCARAIVDGVRDLGLEVRAGLHTGECELLGDDVGGIAVHIGARVCALAAAGEVLVSSTVRELVVGSELSFADRGGHALRGVPGEWRLYAVEVP
jgi:class 3 adenylate cyclase